MLTKTLLKRWSVMRGATGGKALQLNKPENHIWFLEHDAAGQGVELLKKGDV